MPINKRILVAVDRSAATRRAVAYVADMVGGKPGFHVGLVHLELPPRMLEWGGSDDPAIEGQVSSERADAYQEMEQEAIERDQDFLQGFQQILAGRGVDVSAGLVQFDEPLNGKTIAEDLYRTAKARDYGTVVVGRHCFSGLKRLFGQHVGEELVRIGNGITIWVVE